MDGLDRLIKDYHEGKPMNRAARGLVFKSMREPLANASALERVDQVLNRIGKTCLDVAGATDAHVEEVHAMLLQIGEGAEVTTDMRNRLDELLN